MMNLYSIALFLHIVGALGFFVALGLETFNLQQLQRLTSVEQLRGWFAATRGWRGLAAVSMLVILAAGFYMAFAAWGGADWISIAFGAMIVQGIIAGILTAPRMRAIQKAISDQQGTIQQGAISAEIDALRYHPLLWVSMMARVGIGLGIIFLMSVKPALMGSLIVMAVSIVVGLAVGMMLMSARRNQPVVA
jgi:hypothetical protein